MFEHKPDKEATAAKHYTDPRSYISNSGHEYLWGLDSSRRRGQIYHEAKGRCRYCGKFTRWLVGEWHHIEGGLGAQRCDCLHNGAWACSDCHKKETAREIGGASA